MEIISPTVNMLVQLYVLIFVVVNFSGVYAGPPPPPSGIRNYDNITSIVLYVPPNCKRKSASGDKLTTDYVGYFIDGKKFDSTYDRKQPMTYVMGAGEVIKGAEMGAMGMCVGERRHTVIPPKLAYGDNDYSQIPGGSTLVFDEVLVKLEDGPKIEDQMAAMGLVANPDGSIPLWSKK